jgi:hypothetical protein
MRTFLARDVAKLVILGIVALSIFSLWFLLDPDPRAIFNEFVLGENAAKFGAPGDYVKNALWGASSIWRVLVSYPLNAGLLIFPVIALFVDAFRRRRELLTIRLERDTTSQAQTLLWMWVITLVVVFSLPSQRDERYLLPAMPALAVLCALNWERLSARAFTASLVATGVVVVLLGYLSLRLEQTVAEGALYPLAYWILLASVAALVAVSLVVPRLARASVNVAILLALMTFAAFLRPFDGARGTFGDAQRVVKGRTIFVPTNFAAKEEGYRFLLPGADVRAYPLDMNLTAAELTSRYPLVAVRVPMSGSHVGHGNVLGERLDIATRQTPEQILDILRGNVFEHLFVKEFLVEAGDATGR